MNFSYNWLRGLVEGLETEPAELARLITMKTAESEGVHRVGEHLARVCAARVAAVEPMDGGRNLKAVLETGRYGVKTVVCGAPNCRAGVVSAYVPAGTSLGRIEVGKAVIGGVESDGMLASGAELGINRDAAGILELDGVEPGSAIPGCEPDAVIEIDNKSITHRPDLWGHFGLAREAAAILRKRLLDPVKPGLVPDEPSPVKVAIEDLDLCPRYSALLFENVTVMPSPPWLQYRLEAIGLNPINNIVDVTNCVMAELAQPMHAFDADLLHGDTIYVRRAPDGYVLVALNNESYRLDHTNLTIADGRGPVALAGVIGGLDSAIHERTRRIVLESACFKASSVRRTSSKLRLRTDASMRFEKAQDPANTVRGLARATELLRLVSPGIRIVGGLADQRREAPAPAPIRFPFDWAEKKLGRAITPHEVKDILERLSFGVAETEPRVFLVSVPSWRATKDVSIREDLVEEVGRMVGYDSIEPQAPLMPVTPPPAHPRRQFYRCVRAMMAAQGFTEVHNYSFISEEQARALAMDPEEHVAVANPISAEQSLMRRSLMPEIYKNIRENSKHLDSFRLFEIGHEIYRQAEGLPSEVPHLAAVLYTRDADAGGAQQGLLEMKRVAECLVAGAEVRPAEPRVFEHPARAGGVFWRGRVVGRLFEFHPGMIAGRAAVLDLDLAAVEELAAAREKRYKPVRRYPASAFDLSIVAGRRELVGELQKYLVTLAGETLEEIGFLYQYEGAPIPEGSKSVTFRLTVAAADHTMSDEEIGGIRERIIQGMQRLGYELRV
jgi:phenylalanyl-tRNA synthetase beta chain